MSVQPDPRVETDGASRNGRGETQKLADECEQRKITAAVAEIVERRAVIDQAKGMLMFVFGIRADAAFEMLATQSRNCNVKLRAIAEQINKDLVQLSQARSAPVHRVMSGNLVSAARQLIANAAVRVKESRTRG